VILLLSACVIFEHTHDHRPGPILDDVDHLGSVQIDGPVGEGVSKAVERGVADTVGSVRDPRFLRFVAQSTVQHVRQRPFFSTLEARHNAWADVLELVRAESMPDVFAAVPYAQSQFDPTRVSPYCERGPWQLSPEEAHRAATVHGASLRVAGCRLTGTDALWTPTDIVTPFTRKAPWFDMERGSCRITSCAEDDRSDLTRSTQGALALLREAWDHPEVQASGAAIQLTITAAVTGTDDAKFGGRLRRFNVLPALRKQLVTTSPAEGHLFLGANILCPDHTELKTCGSLLPASAQHFAYNVVAQHLLAVCYLGREHAELPAFAPWAVHSEPGGYCNAFVMPSRATVLGWGASP
jgi:hypothetical protein